MDSVDLEMQPLTPRRTRKHARGRKKRRNAAVVLRTPGSRITVVDYCEKRHVARSFDLRSEMDARYADAFEVPSESNSEPETDTEDADAQHPRSKEFVQFLEHMKEVEESKKRVADALADRPRWSKVRWVNVVGISWEAIQLLAKNYQLHPLAIEDMIDIPQRTKLDLYKSHLFVVLPLVKLIRTKGETALTIATKKELIKQLNQHYRQKNSRHHSDGPLSEKVLFEGDPASSYQDRSRVQDGDGDDDDKNEDEDENENDEDPFMAEIEAATSYRSLTDKSYTNPRSQHKMNKIQSFKPLNSKNLMVGTEQLSMFLTKDGTILTFFEHHTPEIENAILTRLSTDYTILRESCDPSILFHSLLDASCDLLYPVIEIYQTIINEKEIDILTSQVPDVHHTQSLHLMINELNYLKSILMPVSSLVSQMQTLADDPHFLFLSQGSRVYLNDVSDHILSFIDDISGMSSTIENLINLVFNTISVSTNNSMQLLSLITVLFLPLTFWVGYFGMNFKEFDDLNNNVGFFWQLAAPFTAGLMIIVMYKKCWRLSIKSSRYIKNSVENGYHSIHKQNNSLNSSLAKELRQWRRHQRAKYAIQSSSNQNSSDKL